MKAVFLDLASLAEQDLDLSGFAQVFDDWQTFPATTPEQRLARIGDAEVVVLNKVVLDQATLRAAPRLRLVCITATGCNNIDVETATALGVSPQGSTTSASDVRSRPVASGTVDEPLTSSLAS